MANGTSRFNWNQESINNLVHDAANKIHTVRPLLKLYGKQGNYTTNIIGHQIKHNSQATDTFAISIPINQNLTPVILSCEFKLYQEQLSDVDALNFLATEAAYRVAIAEDAVILLGADAGEFIKKLGVKADASQLAEQVGLLRQLPQKSESENFKRTVLDRIVQGIAELERNGRIGKYAAVVSLDLYQEAMKGTRTFDAPIYEIRPLLIEDGFRRSPVLPENTGVIFSLNGDGLKIAVPVDTSVELVEEKKEVFLQAVKQIRLVIDIPEAVVAL